MNSSVGNLLCPPCRVLRKEQIALNCPSMDFFSSFRERAQQAVNAATELATPVLAEASQAVKAMAETVASDVQTVAEDARLKARGLTDEVEVLVSSQTADCSASRVFAMHCLHFMSITPCRNLAGQDCEMLG